MKNLYPVHPYTIWEHISRWALFLLIPLTQQLLLRPDQFYEQVRLAGTQIALLFCFILLSSAQRKATGYRAGERSLFYQKGLFFRRLFRIPFRYFDSITVRQTLLPSLFGAAHLALDTPAGTRRRADVGLTLSRKALWRTVNTVYPFTGKQFLYQAGTGRILLMSAFWSNPGTGLLLLAPFVQRIGSILGEEIQQRLYSTVDISLQLEAWGIPPASAALAYILLAGWAIALVVQLFRYAHFRLDQEEDLLMIRRGLIYPHLRIFRSSRICALSIRQTLLMRLFRLSSGYVHNIGSGKDKGDRSMLVAASSRDNLYRLLRSVAPWFPPSFAEPIRPNRRSLKSYLLIPFCCAAGFFIVLLFPYILGAYSQLFSFSAVFAAPFFLWWGALRWVAWKTSGLCFQDHVWVIRSYRRLTLYTTVIPQDRIQMVSLTQNPFQKRSHRCNLRFFLYAESRETFVVKQLDLKQARDLLEQYVS